MTDSKKARDMNAIERMAKRLLNPPPSTEERKKAMAKLVDILRVEVAEKKYVYVGVGVDLRLNVSEDRLRLAVSILRGEGYTVHYLRGEDDKALKVLAAPKTTYTEVWANRADIQHVA